MNVMMTMFSLSFLSILFLGEAEVLANKIYTNVWAVKVLGSQQEVNELAQKHGFSYYRHVSPTIKSFVLLLLKHSI